MKWGDGHRAQPPFSLSIFYGTESQDVQKSHKEQTGLHSSPSCHFQIS